MRRYDSFKWVKKTTIAAMQANATITPDNHGRSSTMGALLRYGFSLSSGRERPSLSPPAVVGGDFSAPVAVMAACRTGAQAGGVLGWVAGWGCGLDLYQADSEHLGVYAGAPYFWPYVPAALQAHVKAADRPARFLLDAHGFHRVNVAPTSQTLVQVGRGNAHHFRYTAALVGVRNLLHSGYCSESLLMRKRFATDLIKSNR